jgi:hypothetical protein
MLLVNKKELLKNKKVYSDIKSQKRDAICILRTSQKHGSNKILEKFLVNTEILKESK